MNPSIVNYYFLNEKSILQFSVSLLRILLIINAHKVLIKASQWASNGPLLNKERIIVSINKKKQLLKIQFNFLPKAKCQKENL